ncbi:hypothetical protein [Halostagnicola larsenii]|nr:hypothetical protein [Halostagnicola larsenii]
MSQSLHRSKSVAVSGVVGLALCICTFAVHIYLAGFEYDAGLAYGNLKLGWLLAGSVLLGAIPALAWVQYQLRTPVLVALGGYLFLLVTSWPNMIDSARSASASATITMFELVLTLWVLPLAIALFFGFVENLLRPTIGRFISVNNG